MDFDPGALAEFAAWQVSPHSDHGDDSNWGSSHLLEINEAVNKTEKNFLDNVTADALKTLFDGILPAVFFTEK